MAVNLFYEGTVYKLRAGSPIPVSGGIGDFVLQTFKAEKSRVDACICIEKLPSSDEFRGQGGNLMSASFSRLQDMDTELFQGKRVYNPEYIEEEELKFNL